MPNKNDPYDFSDAFYEEDPYDFSDAFSLPDPKPRPPRTVFDKMLIDSGIVDPDGYDPLVPPKMGFQSAPASSTGVTGVGSEGAPPPPQPQEDSPLQVFLNKFNDMARGRIAEQRGLMMNPYLAQGAAAGAAAIGTASDLLVDPGWDIVTMRDMGVGVLEDDQNLMSLETLYEFPVNAFRSFYGIYPAMLHLPEALMRDPDGTVKAFVEFVPHQASLVFKAIMPAENKTEEAEKRAAWKQLYEDPMGPLFATLMAGTMAKVAASTVSAAKGAAKAYKVRRGEYRLADEIMEANKSADEAMLWSMLGNEAKKPSPPPNMPSRPTGAAPEKALDAAGNQLALPNPRAEESFLRMQGGKVAAVPREQTTPRSRRITTSAPEGGVISGDLVNDFTKRPGPVIAGSAGIGEGMSATGAPPTRSPINRYAVGAINEAGTKVPVKSVGPSAPTTPGASPLGHIQGALEIPERNLPGIRVGDPQSFVKATEAASSAGTVSFIHQQPVPPQPYQPFLRSGRFTESKILDAREGKSVMESMHPVDVVAPPKGGKALKDIDPIAEVLARNKESGYAKKIITTAASQLETAASKSLVTALDEVLRLRDKYFGQFLDDARKAAVHYQASGPMGYLRRKFSSVEKMDMETFMAEGGGGPLYELWAQIAKDKGVTIKRRDGKEVPFDENVEFKKTGPWRLKSNVARDLWADLGGIYQIAIKLSEDAGRSGDVKYIAELIRNHDKGVKGGIKIRNKEARKAVASLQSSGIPGINTRADALAFLAEKAGTDLFMRRGVERARTAKHIPKELLETNPAALTRIYAHELAQTLAEVEVFGSGREGLKKMLQNIERASPSEAKLAGDLADIVMGVIDREKPISYGAMKTQRIYGQFMYGAKIGLGFAPVVQITQPLISVVPDAGALRYLKGTIKAMSPEYRAILRRNGVTGINGWSKMMGMSGDSWLNAVPTIAVFNFLNKALDYTFAATGEVYARDLHRIANKDGAIRQGWAQKTLKEKFGIDHTKPIEASDFIHMTRDYAAKMQLHPNPLIEPMWMNLPQTRWLGYLKRFAYKQTQLSYDILWGEAKKGNVMPILRAASYGQLGGEAMNWAKDRTREFMTGQPVFHEDDPMWQRVIRNYAVLGTLGLLSDLARIDEEDPGNILNDVFNNIEFAITPVAISDIANLGEAIAKGGSNLLKSQYGSIKDREEMTPEEAARRFGEDAADILGSYGYFVSRHLRSDQRAWQQNKKMYSNQLKAARRAYFNGDETTAENIMWEWNTAADQYPVEGLMGEGAVQEMGWDDITNEKQRESFER